MIMLKVTDLKVNYGGIEALKGISFDVRQGQIVSLIGANGAGKSTTLRAISGLVKPSSGSINFMGRDITSFNSQKIVAEGVALVPEGRRVFANLTVKENLKIGAYLRKDKDEIEEGIKDIYRRFPRLREREWQLAGTLSGGEQQMLAVGRAMMAKPKLMMMDEPSLGLAPLVVKDIISIIRDLKTLPASERAIIEDCLREYYLIPKVEKLLNIEEKFGVVALNVETDRGPARIELRSNLHGLKLLYGGRVLMRDSNDNRYEIPDLQKIDKRSRMLIDSYL